MKDWALAQYPSRVGMRLWPRFRRWCHLMLYLPYAFLDDAYGEQHQAVTYWCLQTLPDGRAGNVPQIECSCGRSWW